MQTPPPLDRLISLDDVEAAALALLEPTARDYYISGARDEITLRRNRAAFSELAVYYRVMVDVSQRDLRAQVLGHELSMPIMVAPTAFHKLAHPDGELATARAAGEAGTIMTLSTLSNTAVEDVLDAASGPVWFQLYVYRDREATRALIARAEAAGAQALVLTVDAPLLGARERDMRNAFRLPPGLSVENMLAASGGALPEVVQESGLAAYFAALLEPALTWSLLDWLAAQTRLPILVKGVVRADDARRAVDHGAAGIVVSNHGGRQLDTSPATIEALPAIARAVDGQVSVLLDGGIRRGTDVLKAVALGADAVCIGRPVLYGLSVGGQAGVAHVLELLRRELDLAMALAGCPSLATITRDLLSP